MKLPLLLLTAALSGLAGCASSEKSAAAQLAEANSRAIEQRRMKAMTMYADDGVTQRGAEVLVPDHTKAFNPAAANFGRGAWHGTKSANTGEFRFIDRVRTKNFRTRDYAASNAWEGNVEFQTKEARTKTARETEKTAGTRSFATDAATEASRTAKIRALPDGTRQFLGPEHDKMKRAIRPEDQAKFEQAWRGNLAPLTMDDVKKLLNKN